MPILITGLFIISTLINFGLIYFKLSSVFSQQIISVVLLFAVILLGKFNNVKQKQTPWQTSIAVLLSSFLVQILVISSGGLYSPLLIIIHIYTLGAIFLLNSKTPIFFLIFSLCILAAQLRYDPILAGTFLNDPWTAVIYGMSFLIIIPLALYLSHNYFMKDAFTKILKNYIKMQEQKESSILTALNDLVVVTDQNLSIVSVNVSVEKYLQIDKQDILGKKMFDVFTFKDLSGNSADAASLSIDVALKDHASHFVEGFMLITEANIKPKPVLVQIRPLADSQGVISQIVIVMSEPAAKREEHAHASISEAIKRKNLLLDAFARIQPGTTYDSVKANIGLVTHIEEDIFLSQELEDHAISEKPVLTDVVILSHQKVAESRALAAFLGISATVTFADPDAKEAAYVKLHESQTSDLDLSPSIYSLPLEKRFVGIILRKMLEIGMIVASSTPYKSIVLDASQDNDRKIYLKVSMPNPGVQESELNDLFELNNPVVGAKTRLASGSGMEGFLFKKLCTILNIPYQVQLSSNGAKIEIQIALDKAARTL
ncbi:PAS domain-containing protein [Candidatus Dojkabacteria bacterium]|uniref:PAS domain-containing protein n=1 Tax=Candidatus Dojkabacteria bacterium TaxID=2099670 RepID=A0A5C7JA16_9BACT|nr:MAG: PAS domain-containing protein [Candidatus Dojkabacteria bacterium]